jgi:FkbM family methyltransferase
LEKRFINESRVSVYQMALSDRVGIATIQCNKNEQTNSLLQNDKGNMESLPEATQTLGGIEIPTVTLDQWYRESGIEGGLVIKCDVQGAEGLMLTGGTNVFASKVFAFYSEAQIAPMYEGQTSLCELHRRLTNEFDFSLANIYPCYRDRDGRALQTDALWIRNDKF